jgi:hypothetical protein
MWILRKIVNWYRERKRRQALIDEINAVGDKYWRDRDVSFVNFMVNQHLFKTKR